MCYTLTIPARVNLLGNPSDGVEGAHATISAAIDTYAGATIGPSDVMTLELVAGPEAEAPPLARAEGGRMPLPYDGELDLVKAAVNRLYAHSSQFRRRLAHRKFHLRVWTSVPRQSGLGGSSLLVLLTLGALRAQYELEPQEHNDYVLAELAQRVEAQELHITCGYADRYVPLFGGLAYLDYRGKLHQKPIHEEPYVTYERLHPWVPDLPVVIAYTGITHDSGDVHRVMRTRYMDEYKDYEYRMCVADRTWTPEHKPFMLDVMEQVGATAWRGKMALLRGQWRAFGALMDHNHELVNRVMLYCGLPNGAGDVVNRLIGAAKEAGALGAKLTGAGGGGSIFALAEPGGEPALVEALQRTAATAGLEQARIWCAHLDTAGLRVWES